jgi:hypothetical protein
MLMYFLICRTVLPRQWTTASILVHASTLPGGDIPYHSYNLRENRGSGTEYYPFLQSPTNRLVCLGALRKSEEVCAVRDDYEDLLPSDHLRVAMRMLLIIHIPRHLPSVPNMQEKAVEAMEDILDGKD